MKKLVNEVVSVTQAELQNQQNLSEYYMPRLNSVPAGVHEIAMKDNKVLLYKETFINMDGFERQYFAVALKDLSDNERLELVPLTAFRYQVYMTEDGSTYKSSGEFSSIESHDLVGLVAGIESKGGKFTLSFLQRAVKIGSRYKTKKPIVVWKI